MAAKDKPHSTQDEPIQPEAWEDAVWKAYCKGNRNIADLCRVSEARGGSSRWHTIRKFVDKRRKDLALALAPEEERADYEAGLESDLQDADAIFNRASQDNNLNAQIGALKTKMEAREKLAASRGVVTQRRGEEHSGNVGVQVQAEVIVTTDDHTAEVARILAESGALEPATEASPEAAPDEVHNAQPPA